MAAKHPPTFDCTLCDRKYHAQFALDDHYRGSAAHPNCARCGRGVRDSAGLEEVSFYYLYILVTHFRSITGRRILASHVWLVAAKSSMKRRSTNTT